MEKVLSAIAIILGLIVVLIYGLVFFGKHGVLTGTEDETDDKK